ncbi:MAG: hypothetical protein ACFNLH_09755, partial [Corynebacterium matruchotii]
GWRDRLDPRAARDWGASWEELGVEASSEGRSSAGEVDVIAKELDVPIYDVEETGYPPRMRQKIERDRLLKKREEQRKRREKFERGET